ncbi:Na+/H+ antiporter [Rhodopila globiformis]|uniref:Na+/H+ antiporter n=1 Tax=Rhodopila globiformis TaxID=1071 RepID=A0A2S6NN00_RHOGL|nr:Na+/H+ antiporter [Rhodopila globiformis]PPQ38012.1 Na+/H+ antiporter [Rhodopila globiformis]
MNVVHSFEVILALLAAVIVLVLIAKRLHLPPAAMLILGGIGLALVPGLPTVQLNPDLALVLFLPPLLQADAYTTAWRDFRADLRIILQLAVGAVVFTTAAVGIVTHAVLPSLPWAACFALGAIVSPPDAVAAAAVLEHVHLPRRVVTLLEGESLVNDASGLVLYRFSVAAALTGAFSLAQAAESFVLLAVGGVAAGVVIGYLGSLLLGRLRDPNLATVSSFLLGWGAYIGAEALSVSGVLATVACGLIVGWRQHETLTAETRVAARATWGLVTFVLESLIFILIGLSLRGVLARLDGVSALPLLWPIGAIIGVVILSRFAWVLPSAYLLRLLIPPIRRRDPYPPLAIPVVISWAGMRGVVSLAAALALPERFPGRDFIIAATFAVILVTVLLQGATLAPLIRLLRLERFDGPGTAPIGESAARARLARAQLAAIERVSAAEDGSQRHPRLLEQYSYRMRAAERFSQGEQELRSHRQEHFSAVLIALAAGREELVRLHRTGEIHDSTLHALESELDLEELTARRFADKP